MKLELTAPGKCTLDGMSFQFLHVLYIHKHTDLSLASERPIAVLTGILGIASWA